jgi:predicted RNA-binding Zn ribbon-like protein
VYIGYTGGFHNPGLSTDMTTQTPEARHYHLEEGHLCLDFVNTAYIQVDPEAPFGYHPIDDKLTDLAALAKWSGEVGVLSPGEVELLKAADPKRIEDLRTLREALRRIIRAHAREDEAPQAALKTINRAIPPVLSHTRLGQDETGFLVEIDELCGDGSDPDHVLDHLFWAIGQSIFSLLTDPEELGMVRECPSEDCGYLFRDTSHGRRRWCDMKTCGNRAKVQRYRQRHKAVA